MIGGSGHEVAVACRLLHLGVALAGWQVRSPPERDPVQRPRRKGRDAKEALGTVGMERALTCIIGLGVQGQHGLEVFIAISFCLVAKFFMSNSFVTLWTTGIFQKGSLNCTRLFCLYLNCIR